MIFTGKHVMYRLYDDKGVLLYLGITQNLNARLDAHRHDKLWWTEVATAEVEFREDRSELERAEIEAIEREQPRYNVAHGLASTALTRTAPSGSPRLRSVRLSAETIEAVQAYADRDGLSWNEALHRLLKWGIYGAGSDMPRGWH